MFVGREAMGLLIKADQGYPAKEVLKQAAMVLEQDGVLVMPTDSVYGIGCAAKPHNPALKRIFAIKNRPLDQTLPLLIAEAGDLDSLGKNVPTWAHRLAKKFWPGALTLVVRASANVPSEYQRPGQVSTIALRLPDSNFVRALIRYVGTPLATTSANIHGAPSATSGAGLDPAIVSAADLSVDAGMAPIAVASTIVDSTGREPRILRVGAIAVEQIMSVV